jgi:hypothetical protein
MGTKLAMDGKSGFVVGSEGYVWTERGLLKVSEIRDDIVLGIDCNGRHSWSNIHCIKTKKAKLIRLTTDSSETLLSNNSEIYTIDGIKRASNINNGVLLETANIPSDVFNKLNTEISSFAVRVGERTIEINEKISYLMGAQINAKRYSDKIVFDRLEVNKAHIVASFCDEVRKSIGGGKIYYIGGGKRVRFDSAILASSCNDLWKSYNILYPIRHSRSVVIMSFISGVLDMILKTNNAENPPTYFATNEDQSEFRRFLLNGLRLSGVIPVRVHTAFHQDGSIYFKCSVNTADLAKVGLNFIRGFTVQTPSQEPKSISYSAVRHISSVQGKLSFISAEEPHWSPILDLLPLHRHAF